MPRAEIAGAAPENPPAASLCTESHHRATFTDLAEREVEAFSR